MSGLPVLSTFSVVGIDNVELQGIFTQRFLERSVLLGRSTYVTLPHEEVLDDPFYPMLVDAFVELGAHLAGPNISDSKVANIPSPGFGRLN